MDTFEKIFEDKLSDRCKFFSSLKDECIREKCMVLMYGINLKWIQWSMIQWLAWSLFKDRRFVFDRCFWKVY